ncbi:AAA family ATPase [Desulfosporosinus nitroreducens]|uniref:AAA family ATPase n=1 Tax=Desulfosporosinus nitroreducens TaxID=2018668 RepID=A0ABT8QXI5_9FIRM|nr:AAA family ATPase [Desulfosporosinus nitroreducens]MDO0825865.1 AAA family ATPase [Desulfosporosinus nitroreducens]
MAGYIIKQIEIRNFKYIPNDHPVLFRFNESNIVILGGPNGYGKTTLFDAIELLINGTIKHFNADLLNRGSESIGILANNHSRDIQISGILIGSNEESLCITRRFLKDQDFKGQLFLNEEIITQEQLYNMLKISSNMFDIGTYISQSESLDFLQNKYKNRKAQISTLLENPQISRKIQLIKDIQTGISSRIEEKVDFLQKAYDATAEKVASLQNQVNTLENSSKQKAQNIKLFPSKEFEFDTDEIDLIKSYAEITLPLKQLEEFVKNYEEYKKHIQNANLKELLDTPKNIYMAMYYQKQISLIKSNTVILETASKSRKLLGQFEKHNWSVDLEVFKVVGISNEIMEQARQIIQSKIDEQQKMSEPDKILHQMMNARQTFIEQFNKTVEQKIVSNHMCPLCGTKFEDIESVFAATEKLLKKFREDAVKKIEDIEEKTFQLYKKNIIPFFESYLSKNRIVIELNEYLSSCKNLSFEVLSANLQKQGIVNFYADPLELVFKREDFEVVFKNLQDALYRLMQPNSVILTEEQIILYKSIHFQYYDNQQPIHTIEQIENKYQYIADKYVNKYNLELTQAKSELANCDIRLKNYREKSNELQESFRVLVKKYDDANKEYQTNLTNAIRVPLMIYSGKIIQNYPLGLGIKAVIKTNQLVFEAPNKESVDAYNVLSTGQLNGLAISILLAVRSVYGHPDGLNIVMIDDPLQTIDDISAISLADLLTQQSIGQIILSTHEDHKAGLLRFKFKQANLSVFEQNMQQTYLSIKHENK